MTIKPELIKKGELISQSHKNAVESHCWADGYETLLPADINEGELQETV